MAFSRANGVSPYFELDGNTGTPSILIHGSWGDHANRQAAVPGLSPRFRVMTYDRRGHSPSEKVATQGSAEEDAMDASELLLGLGLAPAHLVGNSYGPIISLKLAAMKPSILRSLVVYERPLRSLLADDPEKVSVLKEGEGRAEAVIKTLQSGDRAAGARPFVETLAFGPGQWDKLPPRMKEPFIANTDTWLDETRDPAGANLDLKALPQFQAPARLSYGGKSPPFFRPIVEKAANSLPNGRIESDTKDGHTPHLSNPEEFVRRVMESASTSGGTRGSS